MNNLFKNIYFKSLIFILIIILFIIIYYLNSKNYDKFYVEEQTESLINAKTYLENSNSDIKFELSKPNLGKTGPIKFVDAKTNGLLGKYPNDWTEKELIDKGLKETIIKIPRGDKGDKGDKGDGAIFNPKGKLLLEEINSDNLKINADNLNLNAKKINLNESLCFGDTDYYCIDNNFISYLKDTNNLINEKSETTNLLNSKKTELEKCNNDLSALRNNMEKNYFSKEIDVPSVYTLTKQCDDEKQKLVNLYQNITNSDELKREYEKILNEKENLLAEIVSKNNIITEREKNIKQCNTEKAYFNKENVDLKTDIKRHEDTIYVTNQNLEACNKAKTDVDLTKYISKSDHESILFEDYVRKNTVENLYTLNSDIDIRFKDDYGNYLSNNYVKTNYYKKDIKDMESDILCQNKIDKALENPDEYKAEIESIDLKLNELEQLYKIKLSNNKESLNECIRDKNENHYRKNYVENYYRNLNDIQNNYILKTECENTIVNDHIPKSTIDREYIKNDDYFKQNYVSLSDYESINTSLEKCNDDKNKKQNEKEALAEKITKLESTLGNMNCTDCNEYTKGVNELLEMCNIQKDDALKESGTLKEDIKKLGDFITQLYNNISDKEIKISKISTNLENKEKAYNKDVQHLQEEVTSITNEGRSKDTAIQVYQKRVEELDTIRNNAVEVIGKLQKNIIDAETSIELTQEELNSKLLELQQTSKQIDKCIEMEKDYNKDKTEIAKLKSEINDWELKTRGSSAANKEINDLDYKLRKALYEKQTHGSNEYVRGKKEGRDAAKKIWKYSLYDMNTKWQDGWEKGKNLSVVGKEEEFMKEKCKSEFEKGVASRQEYVYTDIDMKREIEKTQKEIGNKISEPKECVNII
jgi:hypothetical protein|tara:strand:- start:1821 stop:4436 length:2616 start_codon:yes stop_codon:yes gene_type:complete